MIVLYKEPLRKFFIMLPVAIIAFIAFVNSSFGENEGMKRIVLFESGKGGYDTYRIPAIVKTTKGTLLAFCEGRKNSSSDTGNIDLLLQRSLDNGFTWDETKVIVDDGNDTCGNPCPIVDQKTGTLVLLLTKNKGHENEFQIINGTASPRTVWLTRSTDDGVTWSTPSNISSEVCKPDFRWYATGPCHGINLPGDVWLPRAITRRVRHSTTCIRMSYSAMTAGCLGKSAASLIRAPTSAPRSNWPMVLFI